ncbi:Serine/arginine-rich splicing factor RS40-like protein [Drosera capensis]
MRPIFCGNLEFDARQSELERLFRRYGNVERVDMKSGFAFVYMEDERDADVAIRKLDRVEFGRKGRCLRVEWTKQERDSRRPGGGSGSRKPAANTRPSRTLFVINFDPLRTKERDLQRHFDPYGKVANIRIRRNFAFIQYETQDDATRALESTNLSKLSDRVITVEYAIRDDDVKTNGYSPDRRGRDVSPDRGYDRRRSPNPYRRERGSPDYGYRRERGSPNYGHGLNPNSKTEARGSPGYGRDESPVNGRRYSRSPPPRERQRSPPPRERQRSPPPRERQRSPPVRERSRSPPPRDRSLTPPRGERSLSSPRRERSLSPPQRERSLSPPRRDRSRS